MPYSLFILFFLFVFDAEGNPVSGGPNLKPLLSSKTRVKSRPRNPPGAERYDDSINDYLTERTCWWNEMCKEEFSSKFRCRCPLWSYCSSPGRYYNAFCNMSGTGYLWSQPKNPEPPAFYPRSYSKFSRTNRN